MEKQQVQAPDENSLGGGNPCHYTTWDCKEQPNWDEINSFIQNTGLPPFFHLVNMSSD